MSIYEVLGYGPIIACNEDLGLLVTVNGAYYNLWVLNHRDGNWTNTDCSSPGAPDSLYPDLWKVVKKGEKRLEAWVTDNDDLDEDEEES